MKAERVHLREKKRANGVKGFYLDYFINGKRKYETLSGLKVYSKPKTVEEKNHNKETFRTVQKIRNNREQEILSSQYGENVLYKPDMSFIEFFKTLAEEKNEFTSTQSIWYCVIKHLKLYDNNVRLKDLDEKWQTGFKKHLLSMVKQNSAHSYYNKVKAAMKEAVKRKLIPSINMVKGIPSEDVQRQFLTKEEIQRLINTDCDKKVIKRAFLFSCFTGLRWSDIIQLTWKNIEQSDSITYIKYRQQKTKSVEQIPITSQASELLGNKGKLNDKIFFGLKYSAWNNLKIAQWMLKANITKEITFHCARHTYAYLLLKNGVDIYTVSKMLGHKEIKTTLVYAKFVDEMKMKAVNSLPQFIL